MQFVRENVSYNSNSDLGNLPRKPLFSFRQHRSAFPSFPHGLGSFVAVSARTIR
jgi:hypothetical protein